MQLAIMLTDISFVAWGWVERMGRMDGEESRLERRLEMGDC